LQNYDSNIKLLQKQLQLTYEDYKE